MKQGRPGGVRRRIYWLPLVAAALATTISISASGAKQAVKPVPARTPSTASSTAKPIAAIAPAMPASAQSAPVRDLLAGVDARASIAEAMRESPTPKSYAASHARSGAFAGYAAGVRRLQQALIAGHNAWRAPERAAARRELDAALENLNAQRLLVDARIAQVDTMVGSGRLPAVAAKRWSTHRAALIETLDGLNDAVGRAQATLAGLAPNAVVALSELEARVSAESARSAPAKLGASLPLYRPRLAGRDPATAPAITPTFADPLTDDPPAPADLIASDEAPLSPAILRQAALLDHDYTRIFDFVRGQVRTQWYAGAQKGAEGTLRTLAGNDVDQASLLIALLRASGAPAHYVRGTVEVPVADLAAMLGVRSDGVGLALGAAGVANRPVILGGKIGAFAIEQVFVSAYVPYANYRGTSADFDERTWIPLAPALKPYAFVPASDALPTANITADAFVQQYLANVQTQEPLNLLQQTLGPVLASKGQTYASQLAQLNINAPPLGLLPASLPDPLDAVVGEFAALPDDLRQHVHIVVRDGPSASDAVALDANVPVSQVAGQRVTLAYMPASIDDGHIADAHGGQSPQATPPYLIHMRPVLNIAGLPAIAGTGEIENGGTHRIEISFSGPGGSSATVVQELTAGGLAALVFDAQDDAPKAQVDGTVLPGESESRAAILLANFGAQYVARWDQTADELANLVGVGVMRPFPSVALVINQYQVSSVGGMVDDMQWVGVGLDAALRPVEPYPQTANANAPADWMQYTALQGSALEQLVFQQQWSVDSISADKGFGIVYSNNAPVLTLTQATGTSGVNQPQSVLDDVAKWLAAGYVVDIPRDPVTYEHWSGAVWRVHSLSTGETGYFIAGTVSLAGGATALPPSLWYLQDLVALLGDPYAQAPDTDPLSGAILTLDADSQNQDGVVGTTLAKPLRATVLDIAGRPVQGASVQFRVSSGSAKLSGGAVSGATEVTLPTDSHGEASATLRLDTAFPPLGVYRVTPGKTYPQFVGYNSVEVTATAKVGLLYGGQPYVAYSLPDAPSKVAIVGPNLDLIPGMSYNGLGAVVRDQYDNAVANVPVTLSVTTAYTAPTCGDSSKVVNTVDASLFAPGQCPTYVPQLTGASCASPSISVLSQSAGAPFFVVPPANGLAKVTVTAAAGGATDSRSLRTEVEFDPCYWNAGYAITGWAYAPLFGQRPLLGPKYQESLIDSLGILDAAPLGAVLPVPNRADAFTMQISGGTHVGVVWKPATGATVGASLRNGDLESWREVGGGTYLSDLRVGPEPGPILGDMYLQFPDGSFAPIPGAQLPSDQSNPTDFIWGWAIDMQPPLLTPLPVPLTPFDATDATVTVVSAAKPAAYVAAPVQFDILQGEEVVASTAGVAGTLGAFTSEVTRGLQVDPKQSYGVRMVINDGTPFRMESKATPLTFGQGVIGGYGFLPHVVDTPPVTRATPPPSDSGVAAAVAVLQGRYPRSIDFNDSVDVANAYTCAAAKQFAFLLDRDATVSLVFHQLDAQGNVSPIGAFTPIDNVAYGSGLQEIVITSDDLSVGDYQYELKATASDGTVESYLGVASHHSSRHDSLTLTHPFVKGVDLFSGGAVVSEEDIAVGGRGPGMKLTRTYASHQGDNRSWFGRGWSSDLDMQVLVDDCNTRIVTGSAGQGQRFAPGPGVNGTTVFTALDGYHGTLIEANGEYDFYAKDGTRYHFGQVDTAGPRLSYIEDTNGNRVAYTYEVTQGAPHVSRLQDSAGRHVDLQYDQKLVSSVHSGITIGDTFTVVSYAYGPGGLAVHYEYDDNANLIAATRGDGTSGIRSQQYGYVDLGGVFLTEPNGQNRYFQFGSRLKTATNGDDNGQRSYDYALQWAVAYDGSNTTYVPEQRVTDVQEPDGGVTSFDYDAGTARGLTPVVTKVTDSLAAKTTYNLNRYGAAEVVIDPLNHSTTTQWDFVHRQPAQVTDALNTTTTYTYDDAGNKLSEKIQHAAGTITHSWTYKSADAFAAVPYIRNRVDTSTDGNGNPTSFDYDSHGNRTNTTRGGISEADTYDTNGDHSSHSDGLKHTWTWHYDANGYPKDAIDPLNHTATTTYDDRGRKIDETDANGHKTSYAYDARDRLVRTTYPKVSGAPAAGTSTSSYDDQRDTRYDRNPNGHFTLSTFDKMGRLLQVSRYDGFRYLHYDTNGNLTSETDFTGNSTGYKYDAANRRYETDAPLGRVVVDEFDALGHVTKETVSGPNSVTHVTEYAYDHALYKRTKVQRDADPTNSVELTEYDNNGNPTLITDPVGRQTVRSYDARDRMVEEDTRPYGRVTKLVYFDDDRTASQTVKNPGHDDQVTSYEYDANGRQTAITDPVGDKRTTSYDNTKNVVSRSDARNNLTQYVYNERDQLVQEIGPETGQTTGYEYDVAGNRTKETWPNGNVRQLAYDQRDRHYLTTDSLGQVEQLSYSPDDEVTARWDANAHVTVNFYDALHHLVEQDLPPVAYVPRPTFKTYDVHGNVLTEKDAQAHITSHSYDALGRRIGTHLPDTDGAAADLQFGYDAADRPISQQNARGQTTSFSYDDTAHSKTQTDPATPDGSFSQTWAYDALNNEISHTDRRGIVTTTGYDAANRVVSLTRDNLTTSTRTWLKGYLDSDKDANGNSVSYKYDKAGRKIEEDRPLGSVRTWTYTPMGDVETATDPDHRKTSNTYTPRRFLETETNNVGEKTTYAYDGEGHRTSMQRAAGDDHLWQYTYDEGDRLSTVTDAYGTTTFVYDPDGNRTKLIDANHNETDYAYDARHLRRSLTYPSPSATVSLTYDTDGNVATLTTANGRTRSFIVDALNRTTSESIDAALAGEISAVSYKHDGNGNVTQIQETLDTGTRSTQRTYDTFDRLDTELEPEIDTHVTPKSLSYAYDPVGNRKRVTDTSVSPAQDITTWTYNELNQNDGVSVAGQGDTSISYYPSGLVKTVNRPDGTSTTTSYDDAGRIAQITHQQGGSTVAQERYDYDLDGNRWRQHESNGLLTGNAEQTTTYLYDLADRLTDVAAPERSTHYTLDAVGNRTHETITAAGTVIGDSTLAYNARNQLATRDDAATHLHVQLTYDNDGNTSTETDATGTLNFTWDGHDRLLGLGHNGNPANLTFEYHSDGLRTAKHNGTAATRYQYDGQSLLAETNVAGNPLVRYHYSATELLSRTETNGSPTQRQYLNDALHTPIATTQAGAIDSRTRYDAWGEVVSQQGQGGGVVTPSTDGTFAELPMTDNQDIGFTGYLKDSESGFYYAKARYYDPRIARFASEDPEEGKAMQPPSLHRYLYAYANPTVYSDRTGKYAEAGHYYTTYYVALRLNYSQDDARKLAFYSQLPDETDTLDAISVEVDSSLPSAHPIRNVVARDVVQRELHALTGAEGNQEAITTEHAIDAAHGDLATQGVLVHRLGDTFAHRHVADHSDAAKTYDTGFGHLLDGTDPDRIQRRPDRYVQYVSTLTTTLAKDRGLSDEEANKVATQVSQELSDIAGIPTEEPGTGENIPVSLEAQQMFGYGPVLANPAVPRSNDELETLSEGALKHKLASIGGNLDYEPEKFSGGYGKAAEFLGVGKTKSIPDAVNDFNGATNTNIASEGEAKRAVNTAAELVIKQKYEEGIPLISTEDSAGIR